MARSLDLRGAQIVSSIAALSVVEVVALGETKAGVPGGLRLALMVSRFAMNGYRIQERVTEIEEYVGLVSGARGVRDRLGVAGERLAKGVVIASSLASLNSLLAEGARDSGAAVERCLSAMDQADTVTSVLRDDMASTADMRLHGETQSHFDGARDLQLRFLAAVLAPTRNDATILHLSHAALVWSAQIAGVAGECLFEVGGR